MRHPDRLPTRDFGAERRTAFRHLVGGALILDEAVANGFRRFKKLVVE